MSKPLPILIVEDSPDDVELTIRVLKQNNIFNEIVVVDDGAEALDYLFGEGKYSDRDMSTMPTVILLDLKLPKLDGLEVLKKIRADKRTELLPVVVLTSSKGEQNKIASYSLGATSYIQKPVDITSFSEVTKRLGLGRLLINEP